MTFLQFFANHGIRLYMNMPAIDLLTGVSAFTDLMNEYPDAQFDLNIVSVALSYKETCKEKYEQAIAQLEEVKKQAAQYSKDLTENTDKVINAMQTTGGFLGDGPSLVPQFVVPQMMVTEPYQEIQSGNKVFKYTNQITTVLDEANELVKSTKEAYDEAVALEKDNINTVIYKLTILHV